MELLNKTEQIQCSCRCRKQCDMLQQVFKFFCDF